MEQLGAERLEDAFRVEQELLPRHSTHVHCLAILIKCYKPTRQHKSQILVSSDFKSGKQRGEESRQGITNLQNVKECTITDEYECQLCLLCNVIVNFTVQLCVYAEHTQNYNTTRRESFLIGYHVNCSCPIFFPPLFLCPTSSPLIQSLSFTPLLLIFFPHLTPRDTNTLADTNSCLYTIHLPPLLLTIFSVSISATVTPAAVTHTHTLLSSPVTNTPSLLPRGCDY